ncbi:hypothetical protein [Helicobacter cynogastricus]|uniref:OMP24 n=1 Tax=Helicobacter cynogastricus TaxID=329937 RepID=A0A1R3UDG7_9HELI|nr:hypothetical protein [Helicobacter cynogastricus]SFZ72060.1 OMP24 [Helicobacter cynogastricus]
MPRGRRILFALLCALSCLKAQESFVQDNRDQHLVSKSASLIERVSDELLKKSGVRLVVFLGGDRLQTKQERLSYQHTRLQDLSAPYVALFAYYQAKKIAIVSKPADLIDIDEIFFERIAPFLPRKWEDDMAKNNARFSFALLNGYTYMADALAQKYHIHLENNIQEERANSWVKTTLYVLLCTLLALFFYGYFFGVKRHGD